MKVNEKTLERMLKQARGADYSDIFIEDRQITFLYLEDGKIEKVVSGMDSGIGMRTVLEGNSAYAYSNDFSETTLQDIAASVSGNSIRESSPTFNFTKAIARRDFRIERHPADVPMNEKIELLRITDAAARNYDKRIRQVSVIYRDMIQNVSIVNSDYIAAEDERIYTVFTVHVIASDDGIIQTGSETAGGLIGFEIFGESNPGNMAIMASERAIKMLTARHAPAGRMPVVISSAAGGTMIHEAIGHGLEADLAQQGLSVYSGSFSETVASTLITVIDDSTLPKKRGSFRFDDEGTPSQKTVLVENGRLKSYIYDRLCAMKDRTQSTGNGRRESYHSRPIPRMSNTLLAPGRSHPEKILASLDRGLFVKKMGGGQVNTVSGDFVFDVPEGYLIEKGSIGEPVRGATLTGNGPQILKTIDMVGSDLGFSIGMCGKDSQGVPVSDAMPTIRIPEIVVGGKV
jgi:TldD protein